MVLLLALILGLILLMPQDDAINTIGKTIIFIVLFIIIAQILLGIILKIASKIKKSR